jgi:DNA (cytosine-5)-methyltransferase 3A
MKILSLFDGISCARVALERAGIPVELYCAFEIDKYAKQVSKNNYPEIIQFDSVVNADFTRVEVEYDLLIGGSPCQDLSIAKKNRQGLSGERSGLFWEYVRILKEVRPRYFILENVASMPKEAKEVITEALGAEPIMINAALVSAQNRKRLFWTNIPNVTLPDDKGILLKDILEEGVDEKYITKNVTLIKGGTDKKTDLDFVGGIRNKDWAKDGKNYSRNFGQGDRVYSPNGKATTLSALGGGRGAKTGLYAVKDFVRKLTPVECERLQGLPDNYTEGVSNTQRYKALGNAFNVDVVAHILSFIPHA